MEIWNAITAASHSVLILAAFMVIAELLMAVRDPHAMFRIGQSRPSLLAVYGVLAALVVERGYYVVARVTLHRGTNMWALHPAPELLSLMLATSIFVAWATVAASVRGGLRAALGFLVRVGIVVIAIWFALIFAVMGAG